MKENKGILIFQALLCVLLTGLLSYAALTIYRNGLYIRQTEDALAWIYTREKVAAWVPYIAPLFLVSLAVTVYCAVKGIRAEEKPVPLTEITRSLVTARVVPNEAMKEEQKKQQILLIAGWAGFAVLLVPILLYVTRPSNFPQTDLEGMFAAMMRNCTPWAAGAIAVLAINSVLREASMNREIEASKSAEKTDRKPSEKTGSADNERTVFVIRTAVLVLAAAFILIGIGNGSARDVLVKAVNICTECVGLG